MNMKAVIVPFFMLRRLIYRAQNKLPLAGSMIYT